MTLTPSMTDTARRVWRLCLQCAHGVYGARPPTDYYANRVAKLLFGTAAQESNLTWERQRTPRWEGAIGGFGKWQVEPGSVAASLEYLRRRPDVLARATQWLFADPNAPLTWPNLIPMDAILWAMRLDDNDNIGVLFSRLHYFRVPDAIPESITDQADYWKRWYNTSAGKGTTAEYQKNFDLFWRLAQ